MFYWFQRGADLLRYESRQISTHAYELLVVMPDGNERVEAFTDSEALKHREVSLARELEDAGWNGPHGWNL
jgi:hypothetical protein